MSLRVPVKSMSSHAGALVRTWETCILVCKRSTLRIVAFLPAIALLSSCAPVMPGDSGDVLDRDGDGISDALERALGTDPDDSDSDADGLTDGEELLDGTSPLVNDSDADGLLDFEDPVAANELNADVAISTGNDVEPNDSFAAATTLDNLVVAIRVFEGRIDLEDDVDIFSLGTLEVGDGINVESQRISGFRARVAIFDEDQLVFRSVTDRTTRDDVQAVRLVNEAIRHGPAEYFFAVTRPDEDFVPGAYQMHVTIEPAEPVEPSGPQVLFLDMDGGTLDPALLGVSEVGPFELSTLLAFEEEDTDVVKRAMLSTIRENFEGFDVEVITTDEMDSPPGQASTILLGSLSFEVFGASQHLDPYNMDRCDDGVVFTRSFSPLAFGFIPPPAAVGVAIGNVVSHEAGHLLGLYHVTDPAALMDEASPAVALLLDQMFAEATLAESTFPLGRQDSRVLLAETVGRR